ncbi:MAG TPA: xanthine dehydrogenase family protein subunit M [Negativicutes bacterium]|nr:xanthine dehydrogenase family protein subunit M [Negativicutes bacterium]
MYLPDFDYYAPASVAEACQLMTEHADCAKVLCGGTDLIPKMKHGVLAPTVMVSIKKIPGLRRIEYVPGKGMVIGAASTHNDVVFSEAMLGKYASVSNAAQTMAANQVRHAGTVGGNIVSAVPSADMPPILIALNASATIAGPDGERTLPLEEVFTGPGKTVLAKNEILTEVTIPDQKMTGSTYFKFALRKAGALAVVGVAAAVEVENGIIKDARVALGAVAPVPMRAKKAEEFLKGKEISDELLEEAGKIASTECKPITDFRASEEYRRDLVRVYTKRALRKAIDNGHV